MSSHADQTEENKSETVASSVSQMQTSGETTFEFLDTRPETVAQRKLQNLANNSPQVSQLKSFQEMANNSYQERQVAQLQAKADAFSGQQYSTIQFQENNTGLPDNLKTGMENLTGHSMDDVKVHRNSDKPAQLNAHAYAQGTDIHVAPGQEKHLPHELGHVVQQKEGRVKPTKQLKGKTNINDDAGLEKEADVLGAKAVSSQNKVKQNKDNETRTPDLIHQLNADDMSNSLENTDSIDAIDRSTDKKRMDVASQEYLLEKMTLLVEKVDDFSATLDLVCEEGASIIALNQRLKKLVATGMAISAVGVGLTIATGGAAAPIALLLGLSTLCPGALVTFGKTKTKKSRNKKISKFAEAGGSGAVEDIAEQTAGAAALTVEAIGDFTGSALETVGEATGGALGGFGILLGVNDLRECSKINLTKILGPKFANEQMLNLENFRSTLDRLHSKQPEFPIKMLLEPKISQIQRNTERLLGV